MRIGFISTYPPTECGIAAYTQYLTDAIRDLGHEVCIVCHIGGAGRDVVPCFDFDDGDLAEKAFRTMIRLTPDVVHIQHEFGLFGKHCGVSVVPLIMQFRQVGVPVVTTLHTVYDGVPACHREVLQGIALYSDCMIVHEPVQRQALSRYFGSRVAEKFEDIPHGARIVEPVTDAKARLDLPPGSSVILLNGYFRPSKNFELMVDIFPEVLRRHQQAMLLLAGKVRGTEHIEYRNMLMRRIANSPAKDHIRVVQGQLPQPVFDLVLSAADVVALPYKITSQSGILAHCLAFGKPVVVSTTPAMQQTIGRCKAGIVCDDRRSFVDALVTLLNDHELAGRLGQNARRYVREQIAWPIIARRTLRVYDAVLDPGIEGVPIINVDEVVALSKSAHGSDSDDDALHPIYSLQEQPDPYG